MSARIRHIGFYVDNVNAAIPFYGALGYEVVYREKEDWSGVFGNIDVLKLKSKEGDTLEFIADSKYRPSNHGVHAAFTVTDMEETCLKLRNLGALFFVDSRISEDNKVIVGFCKDPYGFKVELVEEL